MEQATYAIDVSAATPRTRTSGQFESATHRAILMDRLIDVLIVKTKSCELWPDLYARSIHVLEAMPLPTGEFALGVRRLQNAFDYGNQGEFGAAAFELRMLQTQLARLDWAA